MVINELNLQKQNNSFTLATSQKYAAEDIVINMNVKKAVLTTASGSNSFDIQVPNGKNSTVTFHFSVDANGNTTITERE